MRSVAGVAVDPVTVGAVLAAIAGGAGGALGAQAWAAVTALVRRPFRHSNITAPAASPSPASGEAELAVLAQAPGNQGRGVALAELLLQRAAADGEFEQALAAWWEQARQVQVSRNTANMISGGTFQGPVLQGRDFTGLTFGAAAPAPPPAGTAEDPDK